MQRDVLLKIEQNILDPVKLALVVEERGTYRSASLYVQREGLVGTNTIYLPLDAGECDAMIEALQKAKAMLSREAAT